MAEAPGGEPAHSAPSVSDEGLRQDAPPRSVRWGLVLVWFMRVVALLWLTKGLAAWAALIGVAPASVPFEARPTGYQATVIYFAVIDLVAAVGLWLASAWGGVLWLLAIMSHLILAIFFPQYVPGGIVLIGLFIFFIGGYLTISWLATNEEESHR
jgi:hypothetical protein